MLGIPSKLNEAQNIQFSIREMKAFHTQTVGHLHAEYMENSQIGRLGSEYLGMLYEYLLYRHIGVGYVLLKEGHVVGFTFGRFKQSHRCMSLVLGSCSSALFPFIRLYLRNYKRLHRRDERLQWLGHETSTTKIGELVSVVVKRGCRGSNASQAIVNLLFERLKREGCQRVRWEVLRGNLRAQKFYAKIGGRIVDNTQKRKNRVLLYEKELN